MKTKLHVLSFMLCLPLWMMAQITFYVNPAHENASDEHDGDDPEKPWLTLNISAWMDDAIVKLSNAVYTVDEFRYIDKSVTVEGESRDGVILQNMNDNEFAMGYDGTKFFTVTGEKEVCFRNMTFKNMKYVWDENTTDDYPQRPGGIFQVYRNNKLILENVTIKKSVLPKSQGGAIWTEGILDCTDVLFEECISKHGGAVFIAGDGIANFRKVDFIKNSTLDDFETWKFGGAICIQTPTAEVNIENCFFDSNVADCEKDHATYTPNGGAIAVRLGPDYVVNLNVYNSTFAGNYGYSSGGAIATSGNGTPNENTILNMDIRNCNFFRNYATGISGGNTVSFYGTHGLYKGKVNLINNTFYQNTNGDVNCKSIMTNDQAIEFTIINNVFLDANITDENPLGDGYSLIIQGANGWGNPAANLQLTARNNTVDKAGGSLGSATFPEWLEPTHSNLVGIYNEDVHLDDELTVPETGVPFLAVTNKSSLLVDAGCNEYLINEENIIPQLDIRGMGIKGNAKDIGAYEFEQTSTSLRPAGTGTDVQVYPNPFAERIYIREEVCEVMVFDLTGTSFPVKLNGNTLDTQQLPAGFYVVKVRTKENGTSVIKMQKQ